MSSMRRPIYRGKIVDFGIESVAQPDGRQVQIEVARHPGGAAVVAMDDDNRVCLLRQFRPPLDEWLWELPAGKIDASESPLITGQRELEEEAGLTAGDWTTLGSIITCPGFSDEVVHLYLARSLSQGEVNTEPEEHIERHWLSLAEAVERALNGTIRDAKTVVGLFRAAQLVRLTTNPGSYVSS